jgi:SAM-dependent methyltransferase
MPRPNPEYLEEYYAGGGSPHSRSIRSYAASEAYRKVLQDERDYPNAAIDSTRIAAYCRSLALGNGFLDIGAGYGFFSRAALERGFHVTAIEPSKICRDVCWLMNGLEALPGMLARDFVQANSGSFDVVLMSQVLEHTADVESTVGHLGDLLRPNGIAAIAVPHFGSWLSRLQGKRDMFMVPPEHLNFFSRAGLTKLFERHRLMCCELHTISRIDVSRVSKRIPVPLVGRAASLCTLALLRISDRVNGGMFINAYFRKLAPSPL